MSTLRVVFNNGEYEYTEFVTDVYVKDGALIVHGVDHEQEMPGGRNPRVKVSYSLHAIKKWEHKL